MAVGQLAHRTVTVTADVGVAPGSVLAASAMLSYDGGLAVDGTAEHWCRSLAWATPLSLTVSEVTSPAVPGARHVIESRSRITRHGPWTAFPWSFARRSASRTSTTRTRIRSRPDASPASKATSPPGTSDRWPPATRTRSRSTRRWSPPRWGDGSLIPANFTLTATGMNAVFVQKTIQVFSLPGAQLVLGTQTDPLLAGQGLTYDLTVGPNRRDRARERDLEPDPAPGTTAARISDGGTLAAGQVTWAVRRNPRRLLLPSHRRRHDRRHVAGGLDPSGARVVDL